MAGILKESIPENKSLKVCERPLIKSASFFFRSFPPGKNNSRNGLPEKAGCDVPRPSLGWAGLVLPPRKDAPDGERQVDGVQHSATEQT